MYGRIAIIAGAALLNLGALDLAAARTEVYITGSSCSSDPSYCKTEAERKASQARLDERRRQAEAQRKAEEAERARKEAEIKTFTDKFGAHRAAEARRLQQMREAAGYPPQTRPVAEKARTPAPKKQCKATAIRFDAMSNWMESRDAAEQMARERGGNRCGGDHGGIATFAVKCSQKRDEIVSVDKKGKVTKTSNKILWLCTASGSCNATRQICNSGPAGASAQ